MKKSKINLESFNNNLDKIFKIIEKVEKSDLKTLDLKKIKEETEKISKDLEKNLGIKK
tara:strand:+ start:304 stop:477 length:174 start_codon:yes stop_codon:yes gene_type:complete